MAYKNKEKQKEYNKKYYQKNKNKYESYREENKEDRNSYNKRYREKNKESIEMQKKQYRQKPEVKEMIKGYSNKYNRKNSLKIKARNLAKKVPLKYACGICDDTRKLEKHHWRYDKPMLVSTLCKFCHETQHVKNKYQNIKNGK